jgi:hypothetical protein
MWPAPNTRAHCYSSLPMTDCGALRYGRSLLMRCLRKKRWRDWKDGMRTDAEVRADGMSALVGALGQVEAEQFVASVSRERFDYTEWRRTHLPQLTVTQLNEIAKRVEEN